MDTTSTTSEVLSSAEAMQVARLYDRLRETESRINNQAHLDGASPAEIRGATRVAEAISAARDALSNVLIVAEVYGDCAASKRVRAAY